MTVNEKLYLSLIAVLVIGIFASVTGMNHYKAKYGELLKVTEKSGKPEANDRSAAAEDKSSRKIKKKSIGDTLSRLKRMQDLLDEKEKMIKSLQQDIADPKIRINTQSGNTKLQDREKMYADMKLNDPEKYKAMLDNFKRMVSAIAENNTAQKDFFAGLDTSGYAEEEMKNHDSLLEKLSAFDETLEKYSASEELSEIDQVTMDKMKLMGEIYPMIKAEKDAAIIALGKSIGYNDEEAAQFRDYLAYLDKMASTPGFFVINSGSSGQNSSAIINFQMQPE